MFVVSDVVSGVVKIGYVVFMVNRLSERRWRKVDGFLCMDNISK